MCNQFCCLLRLNNIENKTSSLKKQHHKNNITKPPTPKPKIWMKFNLTWSPTTWYPKFYKHWRNPIHQVRCIEVDFEDDLKVPRFVTQMPYLIHEFLCSRASIGTQLIVDWYLGTSQTSHHITDPSSHIPCKSGRKCPDGWVQLHSWKMDWDPACLGPSKAIYVHILFFVQYLSGPMFIILCNPPSDGTGVSRKEHEPFDLCS